MTSSNTLDFISVVIPAYNEERRIGHIVEQTRPFAKEVVVVDDSSRDGTKNQAKQKGAQVVTNELEKGYIGAIKTGFRKSRGEILVTMDGDGEHDPKDIPKLTKPIITNQADLVVGKRKKIARPSEKFISWLTKLKVGIEDSGTGFRALRRDLALKLNLKGHCTCGIFTLEAFYLGVRIAEVPINLKKTDKPRSIAWKHIPQTYYVAKWLLGLNFGGEC